MKAVYIAEHGGPEALTYGDLPEPVPGPNDVKIRVRACSLNRLDLYVRAGTRGTRLSLEQPRVLGGDLAGDVVEVGSEVTRVQPGDRVVVNPKLTCRQCPHCVDGEEELCVSSGMLGSTANGGYAEFVTAPAVNAVRLPSHVSYEEAAALPTVFLPSWTILIRRAALKPWETALVMSASSGVGSAAIQVAKRVVGARVITTTSSEEKAVKARELGADEVINYKNEDIAERVKEITGGRGVDVVVDHVGADFWPAISASLAPGGRHGICGVTSGYKAELQMGLLFLRNQTVFGVFMGRNGDLQHIVDMAASGAIRGVVDRVFPLERTREAHEVMEEGGFFGKLVLKIP